MAKKAKKAAARRSAGREVWSAYLDWSRELREAAGGRGALWEPVFVSSDMATEIFFARAAREGYRFDPRERAMNAAGLRKPGAPLETILYRRVGDAFEADFFTLRHVGAAVDFAGPALQIPTPSQAAVPEDRLMLGIVDDGIGFLNERFRRGQKTRVRAAWVQAVARRGGGVSEVAIGREIEAAEIDAMLAEVRQGQDEAAIYRRLGDALFAPGTPRPLERPETHGTHLLDLACGADSEAKGDEAKLGSVPILAVGLPPQAVADTTGVTLETYALQGLRWILARAVRAKAKRLVVNMSLGVHAGPKDGSKFFGAQIAREIARAKAAGIAMTVVLPYGNDFETRLLAGLDVAAGKGGAVELRLPPDDPTPGFVEVRPEARASYEAELGALRIGLVAPDGRAFAPAEVKPGRWRNIGADGEIWGRLYHLAGRPGAVGGRAERPFLALALAPTACYAPGKKRGHLAPAGGWTIRVETTRPGAYRVLLQVQRDDRAATYSGGGRQAYFDAPGAHEWNPERADYSRLGSAGPLTTAGSNSAYSTAPGSGATSVGGALVRTGKGGVEILPADYASEGARWSGAAPDASAVSERSRVSAGVRASGTVSGTTARFAGSSTAAATYSRQLLIEVLGGQGSVEPPPRRFRPRLGFRTVTDNPAFRDG